MSKMAKKSIQNGAKSRAKKPKKKLSKFEKDSLRALDELERDGKPKIGSLVGGFLTILIASYALDQVLKVFAESEACSDDNHV